MTQIDEAKLSALIKELDELRRLNEDLESSLTDAKSTIDIYSARIVFYESLEQLDLTLRDADNIQDMMKDVLEFVLATFGCDRAWLLYPGDPDAETFMVPMECTRPEFPGARASSEEIKMNPDNSELIRAALKSRMPLVLDPNTGMPLPETARQFDVQSMMVTAFFPKVDDPWIFGMHQCSHARVWTPEEQRLLHDMGAKIADSVNSLLYADHLEQSEMGLRSIIENTGMAIMVIEETSLISECNTALENLCGYTKEEIIDKLHWYDLVPEERRLQLAKYHFKRTTKRGFPPEEYDLDIIDKKGNPNYSHIQVSMIPGTKRRVVTIREIKSEEINGE